jgi:WhiB family redox-sensing transcriptional regulator
MSISYQRPAWQKHAACNGLDVNLFFPRRGEANKVEEAKKICAQCPVQEECRQYGIELAQEFDTVGIFGGLTQRNRRALMKEQGMKISYGQSFTVYDD